MKNTLDVLLDRIDENVANGMKELIIKTLRKLQLDVDDSSIDDDGKNLLSQFLKAQEEQLETYAPVALDTLQFSTELMLSILAFVLLDNEDGLRASIVFKTLGLLVDFYDTIIGAIKDVLTEAKKE